MNTPKPKSTYVSSGGGDLPGVLEELCIRQLNAEKAYSEWLDQQRRDGQEFTCLPESEVM